MTKKFCMSGLDLGATVGAWVKANGYPVSSPKMKQVLSYAIYKSFVESPDHLSKSFFDKALGILNVYDAYLVYNVEGKGPFWPNQDDGMSHVSVIRYAMNMKGHNIMWLHAKTGIDYSRLERIVSFGSTYVAMRVYEAAIAFEALGITCFIMPKVKSGKDSMVATYIKKPKLLGSNKKKKEAERGK